jgi:hypothetical protein
MKRLSSVTRLSNIVARDVLTDAERHYHSFVLDPAAAAWHERSCLVTTVASTHGKPLRSSNAIRIDNGT